MRYCVIGYPIKHSLSPKIHNRAFRKQKIDAHYEAVEVMPKDLAKFMRGFRKKYEGANVTIPHKVAVMKFLDEVSLEARKIGAVNTIVNHGGKLIGFNTDVWGAMSALKRGMGYFVSGFRHGKFLGGKNAIVLGAGGAARAVVFGLKKAGAKVLILNRTLLHAKKLAMEFGIKKFGTLENFDPINCGILINTTSVGMWPKSNYSPLPNFKKQLASLSLSARKKIVVMDIVYRPHITKLLRDGRKAGCKIITGDHMFLGQAAKAFQLWTGKKFPF